LQGVAECANKVLSESPGQVQAIRLESKVSKAGRRYEADVVKAPDWVFLLLGLVFGFAAVREERASSLQAQKSVTTRAKRSLLKRETE